MVTMLAPALLWCLTMAHGKHFIIETEDQHGLAGAPSEAGEDYYDYGHKGDSWSWKGDSWKGDSWKKSTWKSTWKTWDTTWSPKTTLKMTTTPRRCIWGPWGVWSQPTATCGSAKKTRERFCRCFDGSYGKGKCGTDNTDTQPVRQGPCVTPGPKPYLEGKRRKRF